MENGKYIPDLFVKHSKSTFLELRAVVYTGFPGGGSREQWGGVLLYIGVSKIFRVFQTRKFSKNVKKSMKKILIFGNF